MDDARWMRAAIAIGRRGLGRVWPNPAVGCVIVNETGLIGRGWTQPGGRPHAEAMALAQAGEAARGATAYVSLEPCAHHGKTPPCADALAAAGVARVVSPMEDPDPRVAGRGFAALRAAGVIVETGLLTREAEAANEGFLMRQRAGRPWVTLKLAATLDGRIATASGESRWITGPAARARTHLMRAAHDAVLVGAGTARADDPMLDVRLTGLESRKPVRVVVDADLRLSPECRLARSAETHPVWRLHGDAETEDAAPQWGSALAVRRLSDGGLDLADAMRRLGERGLTRVLCEGGGGLAASLIAADLADEIVWMTAGGAMGAEGAPSIGPLDLPSLSAMKRYGLARSEALGGDFMSVWRRAADLAG
ncbi:MAG: bifunctional diaminohydroxyphosphoribosylaminopyrimidine deaminase/5-amino-6-(5-phosphoribosylamino)uracil reductase RibD [Pseudomonadota bacterium]